MNFLNLLRQSIVLPFILLNIIVKWSQEADSYSDLGLKKSGAFRNEISDQIDADTAAAKSNAAELKAAQDKLAKARTTSKAKAKTSASNFA